MSDAPTPTPSPSGSPIRKVVLYLALLLMLAALGYDYKVARPAVDEAFEKVSNASLKANADADDFLSKQEISELIGKKASDEFPDGERLVEVYQWMGGLILKSHKLFIVYQKTGDDWMFSGISKAVYDKASVGSGKLETIEADESTAEEDAAYEAESEG
ncbi:MAG: hypothetical protein AAFV88_08555 [Planctomycetota bacterium]